MMECLPVWDIHVLGSLVLLICFGQINQSDAYCIQTTEGVKRFGLNCTFRCHCLNNEQCDFETGACMSGCDYEWTGPACQYNNIALEKISRHSSNIQPAKKAKLAIDRDIETCSFTAEANRSNKNLSWWALWFPYKVTFKELIFMTQDTHLPYFPGFQVTVQEQVSKYEHRRKIYKNGSLCYQHNKSIPSNTTVYVKCDKGLSGQQLRIQLANTSTQLVLCDVRVYGACRDRMWGDSCENLCGFCKNLSPCNATNGHCLQGCELGYKPTSNCQEECVNGTYGMNCTDSCSMNCRHNFCDKENGTCIYGCIPGYREDKCEQECHNGSYGINCQHNCSTNCDVVCNKTDGTCSACKPGWKGNDCSTECGNGSYGYTCSQNCSENCVDVCNKEDGACEACTAGWKGHNCNTECYNGTYGINCQHNCSTNCDVVCSKIDGTCSKCKPGWKGNNCTTDCHDGTYGINCQNNCSSNCDVVCNKIDGTCATCKPGWIGDNCTIDCHDGIYGINCQNNCSANCDVVCNKIDGTCSTCKPGWIGDNCTIDCNDGTYGINCQNNCSANCDVVCNKIDGTCSTCKSGWIGDNCTTDCNAGTFGINCQNKCSSNCDVVCNKTDGTCSTCKSGWIGDNCTSAVTHTFPVAGVVGSASAAVVFATLVVTGLVCLRKRRSKSTSYKSTKESILSPVVTTEDEDITCKRDSENHQNVYCNASEFVERLRNPEDVTNPRNVEVNKSEYVNETPLVCMKTKHEVLVSELKDYVNRGLADKKYLEEEFQKIPYGMQYPATMATNPRSVGKNRYKSMYPYDHSRVVLRKQSHNGSDYINASNIMGYSRGISYIAAQGPIRTTLEDFWRMIWEKNIRTIIMATNLSEEGKIKCLQYWPEISQTAQYGNLNIVMESEDIFAELVVRRLKVYHEGNPEKRRIVTQFHYRAWPDKGVPRCTSSLLHFWYQVRKHDAKKAVPWLVHCSAGVGRTGTFIALDILYEEGTDKGSIDIYKCVSTLREQRVNMVQTKDQYKFLHNIMVEALVLAWKPIIVDQYAGVYDELREVDEKTGKTQLLSQYESLNDEPEVENEQYKQDELYSSAKKTENIDKNRYDNILAANEFLPFLYTRVPGCTDYINAIYIPGYRRKHSYIITQTPLITTAVDCCRLLIEEEVKVIVTFDDSDGEEVGEYLPERGVVKIGPFMSTFVSEEDKKHSILRKFEVKFQSQKHSITQLIFKHWLPLKLTPSNANETLFFLEEIERLQRLTDNKPILIQCLNGAEKSGLVAVLLNILERVRFHDEVSIIQVVRQLKVRRQQIVPNFEQYKFCHDILLSHIQSNSAYANM